MKQEISRQLPSTVFEGMTSVRAVINGKNAGISDRRIEKILIDRKRSASKAKEISYLRAISETEGFILEYTDAETLDEITTGTSHGGIVALCSERRFSSLNESNMPKDGFWVMLEGIEDPYNFGYALRTLYASGVSGVILTERNWMSAAGVVCRSSAGASEMLPTFISDSPTAVKLFGKAGFKTCAAGIRNSVSAFEADFRLPLFLVVGGEKRGISRAVLDSCDITVRLDYGRSFRGSLSAASAASVLSYLVLRQNPDMIISND